MTKISIFLLITFYLHTERQRHTWNNERGATFVEGPNTENVKILQLEVNLLHWFPTYISIALFSPPHSCAHNVRAVCRSATPTLRKDHSQTLKFLFFVFLM